MPKIIPLSDNLIVQVVPKETASKGGIILPEKAVEDSCIGIVVTPNSESYYRDGTRRNQSLCNTGDTVLFAKNSGTKVLHSPDGVEWLAIPEDCIYYKLEFTDHEKQ